MCTVIQWFTCLDTVDGLKSDMGIVTVQLNLEIYVFIYLDGFVTVGKHSGTWHLGH